MKYVTGDMSKTINFNPVLVVVLLYKFPFLLVYNTGLYGPGLAVSAKQGLSRLCVQRVILTPRTLFFDSLDTQKFMSKFADDDFS